MFETSNDDINWFKVFIGCIVAIVAIGVLGFVVLRVQHDITNPQVRQNLVDDPQRSIDVKSGFHTKLAEIISADNTIISLINQMKRYRADHPGWQQDNYYAQLEVQLSGDEQIRSSAIAGYNQYADNPDTGKFRDSWLPSQIDTIPLPSDDDAIIRTLSGEVLTLSTDNKK